MQPKSPSKSKLPTLGFVHTRPVLKNSITLLVIVVLVTIALYFMIRPKILNHVSIDSYFTVVIDCGSTGTRVNVYEWMLKNHLSDGNLPVLLNSYPDNSTRSKFSKGGCEYHCLQTEPGLDKFVGNGSGVRSALEPLILWAEQWVPLERRGDCPIFVLATAGMRRLAVEDVRQVLEDVESVAKEHGFVYRKSWIRVLSGKEEAYYGWVALNYKMGIFGNSSRSPTLGLLDLGGSSLQVVSEIDDLEEENVLGSKIGSVEHRIVAHSLPAFGLNEAFDRTVVMLSHTKAMRETAGGAFEINHPCLFSGLVQNYSCHGCFGLSSNDSENFSIRTKESEVNPIILVGEPNWEHCKVLARAAAINSSSSNKSRLIDHSKCTGNKMLNLTRSTHSSARFHALSGFFVVYNMLNLNPKANLTKIWEIGQQLCLRSVDDLASTYGNRNYVTQYCFRVPYMASLIEDTLCLGDHEIVFGPGDVSWTLGAALVEGEYLWNGTTKARGSNLIQKNNGIISSSIVLFVILLCVLFIVYGSEIKLPILGRKVTAAGASIPSYILPKHRPT